jgi:ABC-type nickel/cobalt efflux system permease component RcnA
LRWYEILFCVLLAVLAGAGHALAPGHGKAMVAAYLIGSRGRVRDAVVLGLVTTLTHTGSVFLFGLTLLYLVSQGAAASEGALQNRIIVGTQMASGFLLLALGMVLFVRRIRGQRQHPAHSHNHSHPHSHGHAHAPPPAGLLHGGTPRLRDLLALGFSGGLVPCPAGLTVILVGLHFPDKLLFALFLLVFFSLGLGSVLVSIGVALISGKALLSARSREGAFFQEMRFLRKWVPLSFLSSLDALGSKGLRILPALSGLFIAGLGVLFCITTFVAGRTEIAALLRAAADWVQGGP